MTMLGMWMDGPPNVTVEAAPEGERVDVSAMPRTGYMQIEDLWPPNKKVAVGSELRTPYNIRSPTPAPPRSAEFLLYCFLSREDRAGLIGDLMQEYQTEVLPKFGPRGAKVWYWSQVIRSIAPVVFNFLSKLRKLGH